MRQPYINTINGVARADSRRMLSDEDRQKNDLVRRVEDPVMVKQETKKVSKHIFLFLSSPLMRIFPYLLDAGNKDPVLGNRSAILILHT